MQKNWEISQDGKFRKTYNWLISGDNNIAYEQQNIALTWKEYLEKLYEGTLRREIIEKENK